MASERNQDLIRQDFRVYYPSACAVCYKTAADIKRCSRCKAVAYCSSDHQILDWHEHKKICKTMSEIRLPSTIKNFNEQRIAMRYAWERRLRRELTPYEEMIALYYRVCAVCFSTEHLFDCLECFCVSYCCKEHQKLDLSRHGISCQDLRLGLSIDQLVATRDQINVAFHPVDNKDLCGTEEVQKHLVARETKVFIDYLSAYEKNKVIDVYKTQFVLLGLNILHAINKTKFTGENLVVHLVGAHLAEFLTDWNLVTHILKHFSSVKTVSYYLIGLDFSDCFSRYGEQKDFSIKFIKNQYHKVVGNLPAPDFVFAFNCGLHEFADNPDADMWRDSVPSLLRYENVPLVLTSYTRDELEKDWQIIRNLNLALRVVEDVRVNSFASLKPLRNWANFEEPVFYMCGFIMIIERR